VLYSAALYRTVCTVLCALCCMSDGTGVRRVTKEWNLGSRGQIGIVQHDQCEERVRVSLL
jgi:hypothetical protein